MTVAVAATVTVTVTMVQARERLQQRIAELDRLKAGAMGDSKLLAEQSAERIL